MVIGIVFGPLIAGIAAAETYKRLGQPAKARQYLALGAGALVVLVAIAYFFADQGSLVRGAAIGGTVGLASSLRVDQQRALAKEVEAGAQFEFPMRPVLLGVAELALVAVALFFTDAK
jgi:hypothetical protein